MVLVFFSFWLFFSFVLLMCMVDFWNLSKILVLRFHAGCAKSFQQLMRSVFCAHILSRKQKNEENEQENVWHMRGKKPNRTNFFCIFSTLPRFALIPFQCYFLVSLFCAFQISPFFSWYLFSILNINFLIF